MLKNTLKKIRSKKGFTLMEMLIVVAIIAILIAIAIPTFSGSLNKAKLAADNANFRTAKAVAAVQLMNSEDSGAALTTGSFNAETSTFGATGGYTAKAEEAAAGETQHAKGATIDMNGKGEVTWNPKTATPGA
ncbi:MAG: prepilin-type N-terminal cleavage/methylation domain-containing protein [Oscillospiraceae bacterium]